MRTTRIQPQALEHLSEWAAFEPKTLKRIFRILEECSRTPFDGIGKPEPLKANKTGLCRAAGAVAPDYRRTSTTI